jgi:ubiquinone/menaquinone biosynthesis C-methylase UbiE
MEWTKNKAMNRPSHADQQDRWDKEHQKPTILLQIDASTASSGVQKFYKWLQMRAGGKQLKGIEMCCGKGRNSIWLANQGIMMIGADYSQAAITEAKKRAKIARADKNVAFILHDVTKQFELADECMDFAFDCFGSTDIETARGRKRAFGNIVRLLKPGGYMMIYLLSTDDEYSRELLNQYPGPDYGSYIHPINGKYEKAFSEQEIKELYGRMNLMVLKRIPKKATFFEKEYSNNYIWAVFQKPLP